MDKQRVLFVSWSGERSWKIAEIFSAWLKTVFKEIEVFFSSEDIDAGKRWSKELAQKLEDCEAGIFIYTEQNLDSLWMAFEAGALSKKVETGRVIPILFGPNVIDLKGPMKQFHARKFNREEVLSVLTSINKTLPVEKSLEDLNQNLRFAWSTLESNIKEILDHQASKHPPKKEITEVLDNMYSLMTSSFYNKEFVTELSELLQQVKTTHRGSYLFIDGQKPAFAALIAATMRAKDTIRSTRFFPMPITGHQDDYGKAIHVRVTGDAVNDTKPVKRYTRIIAANNADKLKDIWTYLDDFRGCNFDLYLTHKANSFELVIIDTEEVFIHFYGQGQVISSTLHIVGAEVTEHFISIYSRLHAPEHDPDILKVAFRYMKEHEVPRYKSKIEAFFGKALDVSDPEAPSA